MGINQSSSGSDKANAIINAYLATGRIGKAGMGPFSITGQPNAMGGREVGGLANQLAAHMDFANADQLALVKEFWSAQNMASNGGLKAVELFEAIESGKVKAIWIMATNPAVSLPDADRMRKILQQCELVVVSDCIEHTDTTACADNHLPATTWVKKTALSQTQNDVYQDNVLSVNHPVKLNMIGGSFVKSLQRMGYDDAFNYLSQADIFREHAALSAIKTMVNVTLI